MKTSIKDRIAMFFGLITYKTYISDCKMLYRTGHYDELYYMKKYMKKLYGKDPAEWCKEAYTYVCEEINKLENLDE